VRKAWIVEIDGHKIPQVNATVLYSEIAEVLCHGHPFGACWFMRADGKQQWSLRSDDKGVNVAEIAQRFGGGGHAHAAGFEVGADNPVNILLDSATGQVAGLHSIPYADQLLASKAVN
jgi:nanoRNase/pAp phosphatase (c-di-AMP/oligoRNAs hydrolase)